MHKALKAYLLVSIYAALDVGTLFTLSMWIGVFWTLLVVVGSTLLGLVSCKQLWSKFVQHCEEQIQQHGSPLPEQIKHYLAAESALILFSMGLFIFPGLLSDVFAYFFLIPVVRGRVKEFVIKVQCKQREEAASKKAKKSG